ncbi:tetratricopeptide repeat protein [Corynebacterium cystitidis]|uniref:Putative thioredoxin n=1 Tax=Corynebacterium cystitidis DSM 20524 TaxID=1121357 RepID=A0A1H9S2Q1_9CORY|nr:tetratricopeptide repeat protein [Corynebacterium cystitidis]WJY82187.1 Thioredoxin [Corynebacterium cystitidis DSM 20524]SER79208.1 putative thioredoxin [Corynebacterium cystitidis DSM 20524]SNV78055.1 thioredoxin [Corynebacterium cystitidis]
MTNPGYGAVDLARLQQQAEAREKLASSTVESFFTVSEDNLESHVLQRSVQVPVVVLVGSARSEESESLKATFQQLAAQGNNSFVVGYVDADTNPQIAQALGVRGVPTVLALAAQRPVTSFEGAQPAEMVQQWVDTLVQQVGPQLQGLPEGATEHDEPEDPRLEAATAALNVGDFDAATRIYDDILAEDPSNKEIKQAKATVAVMKRLDPQNRTTDPLAEAEAEPDVVDKQLDAADAEVVAGAPEKAFGRLLLFMERSAGSDKEAAKTRLLELLSLFDSTDERVKEARTRLASSIF